ncbi:hypothetical protein LTS10_012270 [Elasticomyces elasticus]|nr:hypothetical protein LTS10_012270 [Elasticomyces elasticus]
MASREWKGASPRLLYDLGNAVTNLKQDPSQLSLLLDLPAELRDQVYEALLAMTGGVEISRNQKRSNLEVLFDASGLLWTNKQIHTESTRGTSSSVAQIVSSLTDYVATASLVLSDISATVIDYDFRHVVAFLNKLSEEEIRTLPSLNTATRRHNIVLNLQPYWHQQTRYGFISRSILSDGSTAQRIRRGKARSLEKGFEDRLAVWMARAKAMPEGCKRKEFEKMIIALSAPEDEGNEEESD